ncbi:hypothetical protein C2845_PM07G10690 [Panicum miliaceum]|uniref:thiamine diphosphokinase n=1 Tax=Panicum miliaceum TaxID=4540 RepID=A0A3L6SLR2_PANMI|nr:hypothetical protein C2845_PM07G10690 [Panicum miliaceum]
MGALHFPLLLAATLLFSLSSVALTAYEEAAIALRQKLAFEHHHHPTDHALKDALYSDPNNFTGNWVGPDVCAYNGVFCVPSLHNETESAVATLDMNAADVAGYLPKEIGLMRDLAVLHLNSNRFCGVIPEEIRNMTELYEFDASNNRFVGPFPAAVLGVPKLSYLDIRFNDFDGPIPPELFLKPYDAIFLNNNRFTSGIPETIGKSRATVIVLANNELGGCIPRSIGDAAATLDQFTFTNNSLTGCLPVEMGLLTNATVFDVSGNALTGAIPRTLAGLSRVEQLDLSRNMFTGDVPRDICQLPALANLSVSYNFFTREDAACSALDRSMNESFHDEANCMGQSRPAQRNAGECTPVVNHPVDCTKGSKISDKSHNQETTDLHKCISRIHHRTPEHEKHNLCVLVTGALGGRFDHEAANINVLYLFSDMRIILLSDDCLIRLLPKTHRHELYIESSVEGPHCGLFPVGAPSTNTTTTGLKWNLSESKMRFGSMISTSNIVQSEKVTVQSDADLLWTISLRNLA